MYVTTISATSCDVFYVRSSIMLSTVVFGANTRDLISVPHTVHTTLKYCVPAVKPRMWEFKLSLVSRVTAIYM